ncbi:dual specificity protein phosphatase family protein, partial [Nocardioides sp.]|uniref:protein-tyrosine phosphatase family protein n=1 Tax=Nocardioides sp. TaxID=35761 RepID=UPI0035698798
RSQSATACVVTDEFDLVVSLAQREGYGPDDGVDHIVERLADAGLDASAARRVHALVDRITAALGEGRRVLVRCSGGLNRSGVVVASVLVRQGYGVEEAMAAVRAARGPWALTNPTFVAHLRADS